MIGKISAWVGWKPTPLWRRFRPTGWGGSRGDVAIFQAFELLRGFPYRRDGVVVDVRVLEKAFHRLTFPSLLPSPSGEPAEFDQTRLLRVYFEPKLR